LFLSQLCSGRISRHISKYTAISPNCKIENNSNLFLRKTHSCEALHMLIYLKVSIGNNAYFEADGKELAAKGHKFNQRPVEPPVWLVMFDLKIGVQYSKAFLGIVL